MPRFIVPPKYVYGSSQGTLYIPFPSGTNADAKKWWLNGMIPHPTNFVSGSSLFMPEAPIPIKGADSTHDRVHSKITVTSIRWKFTFELRYLIQHAGTLVPTNWSAASDSALVNQFPRAVDYTGATGTNELRPIQIPKNPQQSYKFRYMMVEFDEDINIDYKQIFLWFYSTYCSYRPNSFYEGTELTEKFPLPGSTPTTSNTIPAPTSVHSNVMRMTTPWTGKFKILADKCFMITSMRPRVSIDITVPINRVFTFADDWQYSTLPSNTVLSPHIYCFVLPPLSYEQDLSAYEKYQIDNLISSAATLSSTSAYIDYVSWMKLNFVDL